MGKIGHNSLTSKVLAALGLFGSVQGINLLCAVLRAKLVALWIGAAGVGALGLLQSALTLFKTLGSLNLGVTVVPYVAAARDEHKNLPAATAMRLSLLLGVAGCILMAVLSPLLSLISFGNYHFTWAFALISPVVLLNVSSDARSAVLQGFGRLGKLGRSSMGAVLVASAIALPLVWVFRFAAIVPMIIIFALCNTLFLMAGKPKVEYRRLLPARRERALMQTLIVRGAAFTLAAGMGFAAEYILKAWVNDMADINTVGLYQAGTVLIGSYLGMFFTAISMEFYPRLSTTIASRWRTNAIMNHEIVLLSSLILPVVLMFMAIDKWVVTLLYSGEFVAASPYLTWAAAGSLARGAGWCMSYALLARGDSRAYMLTEGVSAASLLICSIIGWQVAGLEGLGIAYFAQMAIFAVAVGIVYHRRLGFRLSGVAVWAVTLGSAVALAGAWGAAAFGPIAPLALAAAAGLLIIARLRTRKSPRGKA